VGCSTPPSWRLDESLIGDGDPDLSDRNQAIGTIGRVVSGSTTALTARLGRMVADDTPVSDAWRDLGERAFVDTVGALLAGRLTAPVAALRATVGVGEADGPARSLALGRSMPARSAALIDGTSAHALDYDDVDDALFGHPSAVLVPAILTVGDECGSSGEELLAAYRCGLETDRIVAGMLGIEGHYRAGWHATSTVGTLGAAAAAARLLRLSAGAAQHCFGIAATMAGGSRQNFGTMTKPLHVGLAAEHGVLAAQLARQGLTADPEQLEGPMGFLALFCDGTQAVTATSGDEPAGLNVKLHPCCYATHAAIDAALELAVSMRGMDQVAGVDVVVPPGALAPLIHHRPTNGLQAKFSLEYAVAAALIDREVTLASFEDVRVGRGDVQALLRTVGVETEATPPTGTSAWEQPFAAVVTLRSADGSSATVRVDQPAGHATRPVSDEQLRAKFSDCLSSVGIESADGPYEILRTLRRQTSARAVLDVLIGCGAGTAAVVPAP
jgi:2-methylcitrate dehydratase PrpD